MKNRRTRRTNRRAAVRMIRNLVLVFIIGIVIFGGFRVQAMASESSQQHTRTVYSSVQVQPGDSLWGIASVYCGSSSNADIQDYVDDLKQINNIRNACSLQSGNYIIVYQQVPVI